MKVRILLALLLAAPLAAVADCTWEWLCNGEGHCKQMPICDTVYEKPGPAPASQPPIVPPLSLRPHKLNGAMSGLKCEHIMRKSRSGRWYWDQACFCTDPGKSRDPSAPFANIVRCETPWKEETAAVPAPVGNGK